MDRKQDNIVTTIARLKRDVAVQVPPSAPSGGGDVTGAASSVNNNFVTFNGTSGKSVKDSGLSLDTDVALAANSDSKIASQKAVKAYADAVAAAKVADAINDGTTTIAPSQNAVFDALAGKQPLDSDLTTIAGLTATTDNFIVSVSSAWASRTPAQVRTTLGLVVGTDVEAHDTDLTTIASLSPTNDDIIQRKAGAWTNRTMAQLKTDLVLVKGDVGLGNVTNDAQLKIASNLSDLNSVSTARTNLGLAALAQLSTVGTAQIDNDAVTYAKIQNVSTTSRILGRITAGAGDIEELTAANVKTILALTSTDVGLANVTNDLQLKAADLDNDTTLAADSATKIPSQHAVKAYVDASVAGAGGGDVSSNTATSVDSELALFSSTTGKIIKRATGSGIAKLTSGVLSTVTAPSGALVGDTDAQLLQNKTVDSTSPTAFFGPGFIQPYAARVAPTGWLNCDGSAVSRATYANLFAAIAPSLGTFTVTIATPAAVSKTAHGLSTGDQVYLTTSGALPTGLTANTLYYVIRVNADSFNLATTRANAYANTRIATSGTQSGTHTVMDCPYGLGNGSTTFNVPDFRGRVIAGMDTTAGTAAGRLALARPEGAYGNLGAAGGAESHVIVTAELATHNHDSVASGNLSTAFGSGWTASGGFGSPWVIAAATQKTGNTGSNTAHNNTQPTALANYIIKT